MRFVFLTFLAALLSLPAAAGDRLIILHSDRDRSPGVSGTITRVGGESFKIRTLKDEIIEVDAEALVIEGRLRKWLAVGNSVSIRGTRRGDDEIFASSVTNHDTGITLDRGTRVVRGELIRK